MSTPAEGHQCETARRNTRADRHDALDHHPGNGQPFKAERLLDQYGTFRC